MFTVIDYMEMGGPGSGRHPSGLNVVHQTSKGFVTDFGEPIKYSNEKGEGGEIPRYGVWKRSTRGKMEVIHTTNDLDEAKGKLE